MMEGKVTVLIPNGRRQNIKVTPNTTLLQILEEACAKHGFDSQEYCLRHHNREVGLSQMFRFSGLPNNCLLEMTQTERRRTESKVDICIQLEDGTRKQGQFVSSCNLWDVAEELSPEALADYNSPVAIYMRQEIIGKEQMAQTTLKSLGIIEGRAMIRLVNKNPEELRGQANVYVPPATKEPEETTNERRAKPQQNVEADATIAGSFAVTKDLVQSLKKSSNVDANEHPKEPITDEVTTNASEVEHDKFDWGSSTGYSIRDSKLELNAAQPSSDIDMEIEPEIIIIGERNAILYSLDSTQKQAEELPDSFFELTVQDLKLVLRDLKKIAKGDEDAPLLTEQLRKLEDDKRMLNKIALYKNCVLRIQFPDRNVLQGIFKPIDKISDVIAFVRKFLHNENADFYLFTIPPKFVLPSDETLLELNFVPTAVIHFALTDEDSTSASGNTDKIYLKPDLMGKLTSIEGALYAANKMRISNQKVTTHGMEESSDVSSYADEHKSPAASTGAIPKRKLDDSK